MELSALGFDSWFKNGFESIKKDGFVSARITEVHKSGYLLQSVNGEARAELSGKFMFSADSPERLPTTGDWVSVQFFDDNTFAVIHEIIPRKSVLKRKTPGKNVGFQLIAANIDVALIVEPVDANFNLNRTERFILMSNEGKITPVLLFSKCDLISVEERNKIEKDLGRLDGKYRHVFFSSYTQAGFDSIKELLAPASTYCLLGQSGAGKTTLLNTLIGEELYKVNAVKNKDKKGRHTTTRREMVFLKNGSIFIDTPGLREIGNFNIEEGLSLTFDDIGALAGKCRFSDCTHTSEKDCAVLQAVDDGTIDEGRYRNFIKIRKEAEYLNRSYLEKRRRDKELGKMYKSIMKDKHKK